ncbi:MAG: phosphoribosylamine--glycine ligase [Lentisphaerae bacterium]|nr:phosphoribosylamine--glycine ligase [Lentisphaerota bacterium]
MKILIVGGGGREHALAWKCASDDGAAALYCAPGNAGTAALATNVPLNADDVDGLARWAAEQRPDLTVVGPEAPLCAGLTDRLEAEGLRVFGPTAAAARLEGSKAFAKEIMQAAGTPTAAAQRFTDAGRARQYVRETGAPVVIKADGLAAGKGVIVCDTVEAAEDAVDRVLTERAFGAAGSCLLVEECLTGEEVSILALVDGEHVQLLASSQDHKRVFNNDEGPNTGGMGAYSPAPAAGEALWPVIREQVFDRTLAELKRRGIAYKGVLYAGLMLTADGPKVLEYNCRFGDPETQAILPRVAGGLVPALNACIDGTLDRTPLAWRDEACVCVVMASGGYPGRYRKGCVITGLNEADALEDVVVFHAGTRLQDGDTVTAGGRVLGVTALGAALEDAVRRAYYAISKITFDQAQYRTDIAAKAMPSARREGME